MRRQAARPAYWGWIAASIICVFVCRHAGAGDVPQAGADHFEPVTIPAWVHDTSRMAFCTSGQVEAAARAGVQVIHTNVVWPYYPLRRNGGGLSRADADRLRAMVEACHKHEMKLVLGLPPFPPVNLVKEHPDWRVQSDRAGSALKVEPSEDDLGTRLGCNVGPWGDYLIEVLAELLEDFELDGYSFDGNYHPSLCYCPACQLAYRHDTASELPEKVDLNDVAYRRYLVWRGAKLEDHYRRMQARLKGINPNAVVMSWTVNAGRVGHLLQSPRSMNTRMNLLFDLPMQEWWHDETNWGSSVAPAFGAAYLRGIVGGRPNASEPYLMSRGDPYGSDSFPRHERIVRALQAITQGSQAPESFGWPGHADSTQDVFRAIGSREEYTKRAKSMPWAAMLVSEQTRQFYAYGDIAERYLPHLYGTFRAAYEEHRPLDLINDWDLNPRKLAHYRVLVLPCAAALSDTQAHAVREFVNRGGGLVATCETSLCDELGQPRADFALADLFGVSYRGRASDKDASREEGTPVALDGAFWKDRQTLGQLVWGEHALTNDAALHDLVPSKSVVFKGPVVRVSEPRNPAELVAKIAPRTPNAREIPGIIVRKVGEGRVVYLAAGLDAALWSYAYPYERRLLVRAIDLAAGKEFPISIEAPMCVQATFFEQKDSNGRRVVVHLFNGADTAAGHALPKMEVPLREESLPVAGIRVRFEGLAPKRFHIEPGGKAPLVRTEDDVTQVELPPLEIHAMLVGELEGASAASPPK